LLVSEMGRGGSKLELRGSMNDAKTNLPSPSTANEIDRSFLKLKARVKKSVSHSF